MLQKAPRRFSQTTAFSTVAVWAAFAALPAFAADTALDRYVKQPDPAYSYRIADTVRGEGFTSYIVEMTSQAWRKPTEVDRTVWKHWLTIVKPDRVEGATAYLFITGGSTKDKAPNGLNATYTEIALTTHSVAAELQDVPNEPLTFADDPKPRSEDGIIAYTWIKFMKGGDETWPLRLPMTKAAVRALDTITAVMASPEAGAVKVEKFVVSGGSKRGWTAWTTAAVDKRVVAVIPASIDLLNLQKSFEHHYRVYGFWAPAVKDYDQAGVMDWTGTPEYRNLLAIEEPYSYRDRLTMPKFMVYAAGDQFFLPDSSRFYFDDLQGEKYLRYVPNADHSLRNTDARQSMLAFYQAFLNGTPRPRFTWSFEPSGDIRVTSKDKPTAVKLWQAVNPEHRDFRLETLGPEYQGSDLQESGPGVYVAHVDKPEKGWRAYFVELTYPSGGKYPFKFTTAVRVTPDTEPFPPYQPKKVK
ncbi:MAG TPA: PhoPQ-activated pathogenicity-related family protein [Bryobacteraceae bacterium]|nr:PhoPQ-activated pathogenicity-related family protein [Bryobacteraceae bacterium]